MTRKILIVDDQADLRKLIRLTLLGQGYELMEASDGEEAVRRTREWRPDLLILDVMMPGALDGFGVCEVLRADPALRGTLIMMVTARAQQSDLRQGESAGADAYLVKPFSPAELLGGVEFLLARL